ncbi:MAG: hypothetical protein IMY67_10170 [Bacteroidetes bacterium]|nr:hypothetical protein [Bacteroidota bacterium]
MNNKLYTKGVVFAALLLLMMAIIMVIFEKNISDIKPGIYLNGGVLSDAQKESLKVMLDLNKLLMNWSIAVIGAVGFFLKLNVEKDVSLQKRDLILSFIIIIVAVTSLFLGHLSVDRTSEMLSLDLYPVNNETIRNLGRFQYLTGLSAITLFGFHVFQFFWARINTYK